MKDTKKHNAIPFRGLTNLVDNISGKRISKIDTEDAGLGEAIPFQLLGLVRQREIKLAMLLESINPTKGGVLLIETCVTAKTTAAQDSYIVRRGKVSPTYRSWFVLICSKNTEEDNL